jgi:hypothetical protein
MNAAYYLIRHGLAFRAANANAIDQAWMRLLETLGMA